MNITKFFNRTENNPETDYIAEVNKSLQQDPTSIDPNSPLYQNAIKQYNGELKKGNTMNRTLGSFQGL